MSKKRYYSDPGLRTQFQIDRVAFFSDAVIAIALTMMVLEIRIPTLGTKATLYQILATRGQSLILQLVALFICFLTIGRLWIKHHELFEHIINYNLILIRTNLYFLFSVMLLPITISFLLSSNNPPQLKGILFMSNIFFTNLTYLILMKVVYHPDRRFSALPMDQKTRKSMLGNFTAMGTILGVIILLALNIPWAYTFFAAWPFIARVSQIIQNKRERVRRVHPEILAPRPAE